jgi:hypothetical protein
MEYLRRSIFETKPGKAKILPDVTQTMEAQETSGICELGHLCCKYANICIIKEA